MSMPFRNTSQAFFYLSPFVPTGIEDRNRASPSSWKSDHRKMLFSKCSQPALQTEAVQAVWKHHIFTLHSAHLKQTALWSFGGLPLLLNKRMQYISLFT